MKNLSREQLFILQRALNAHSSEEKYQFNRSVDRTVENKAKHESYLKQISELSDMVFEALSG